MFSERQAALLAVSFLASRLAFDQVKNSDLAQPLAPLIIGAKPVTRGDPCWFSFDAMRRLVFLCFPLDFQNFKNNVQHRLRRGACIEPSL